MSIVGLVAWLVAAPISSDSLHNLGEMPAAGNCPQLPEGKQPFTIPITIYLEMHGGMGEPYKCREIAFSLDFSLINLVRDHRHLLKQIAISTVQTGQPIDLRVQGHFSAPRDRGRRALMVTHIYSWQASHQPPLFLRSD
jgi:hypothetical protein